MYLYVLVLESTEEEPEMINRGRDRVCEYLKDDGSSARRKAGGFLLEAF